MSLHPDPEAFAARHHRLAAQIVEIARMRGLTAGTHLTAAPLAASLDVSRSPVLRAFELLAALGVLNREDNRGYFIANLAAFDVQAPLSDEDRLYWRFVNDRLDGHLPDIVDEASIMRRYGIPRRLVVRVLSRLAAEEVVVRRAGLGWTFHAPLTPEEDAASVRYRLVLEPAALGEPAFHAPAPALAAIVDEQRRLHDDAEIPSRSILNFDRNVRFHEAIAGWSGNAFLLDGVRRHNRRRRLTQYRHFVRPARIRQSAQEHLGVLDAIADGALAEARARLEAHIRAAPISVQALSGRPAR